MASGGCLVACSAASALSTHPSTAVEVLQKEALGASSSCGRQSLMMTPMPTSAAITTTEAAAICASTTANNEPTLLMCSGASMIPHPEKAHRGGEDALFLHDSGMGVADGVGSWALQGIDAGLFARSLMLESKKALDAGMLEPGKIMQRAHEATKARGLRGSSTALVLVLVDDVLYSANLGDSSYIVIRGGELYHKEQEQTHGFNTPYQLGHQSAGADRASAAMLHRLVIQPGDVIIAGSDGLFDNLYASRIVQLVTEALPSHVLETATTRSHIASSPGRGEAGSGLAISTTDEENMEGPSVPIEEIGEVVQVLAERIAEEAHIAAASKTKRVPFGDAAEKHGMIWHGGKMDDITVCVSLITGSGAGNTYPSTSSLQQQQSAKL